MKVTLRAARINNDLTIKKVASEVGVSEEVLRNYERGRTFIPDEKMDLLLNLYGMTREELKEEK